jgi:orotate phosphoribosyltransferase
VFRNHLIEAPGFLDQTGVHHEFVSGMHGRKMDFDSIPTDGELFEEWADTAADAIRERYAGQSLGAVVLLSVANGTNRLVVPVADRLRRHEPPMHVVPLQTRKVSAKAVELDDTAAEAFRSTIPDLVLVIEDVGTMGTTSASAAIAARRAGARHVEAINTWQRRPMLERLIEVNVPYSSIIHEDLPTLTPAQCRAEGYCAQGWQLIEHAK